MTCSEQAIEHGVAALEACFRICLRIEIGRRLGDAHERGGLDEGEFSGGYLEVVLSCGLDAVAPVAVVDGVQIHEQDVVFGILLLHLGCQLGLAYLALDRYLVGFLRQDSVANELLCDG